MSKKIGSIISSVVLVILLILVGIIYVPKVFGITPMVVLSGSMEPTYKVGSLIFVKDVEPTSLEVGDNVTFQLGETKSVVTHRIVEINQNEQTMITKGDNNSNQDGTLAFSKVVGKAFDFSIPLLGYLTTYINTTTGMIVLVCLVICCMLISYLLEHKKEKDN